jgi:acyl-coenzyme A thioesterase PaaI-like protein
MEGVQMRLKKKERQDILIKTIEDNPFITDEELSKNLSVSIQTIRLDRLELAIPEVRERIKNVASQSYDDSVRTLALEEIIGEIIDINLDQSAISIFEVANEHVFKRSLIARGHYLFAQANSLCVALINADTALTAKANVQYIRPVKINERVVAKAKVLEKENTKGRTIVEVESYVGNDLVFLGEFQMHRSN